MKMYIGAEICTSSLQSARFSPSKPGAARDTTGPARRISSPTATIDRQVKKVMDMLASFFASSIRPWVIRSLYSGKKTFQMPMLSMG